MAEEHPLKPFYSVLVLAFFCSLLVSGAAVGLRPFQEANKQLDQRKNILRAAGIYSAEIPVDKQFEKVETRIVDLVSGEFVSEQVLAPGEYNQRKAAFTEEYGRQLSPGTDKAGLSRIEKYSLVYLIKDGQNIQQVVLPVRGKGLWSTMFAYVALDADLNTIQGISFYEHGETPGLGGEIENPKWQASWSGKKVYDKSDTVRFSVLKGESTATGEEAAFEVDGLSGATMTSMGVNDLMHFWFGEHGFKPFIDRIQAQGGFNG
ncbi:Na(+)-translocating NADH-quinone reductase subunit C [Desulfogranum japonicum]|uniref:Na(+)-translocating NADH-quinone reductase subunit C n=1 Tax=Desulfogranum japonicum TaxID=231447 RepID=UPI0003F90ADB|nr:Na(+)-translocating NADH-quinone reductase subunit C [Desulfogranum japonicum]